MAARRVPNSTLGASSSAKRPRPATTLEGREDQLIALAIDQVEEQLRNKTAPPSVIAHYLKMSSRREQLEREIKEKEKELLEAKTENLRAQRNMDEMFTKAIEAMQRYRGDDEEPETIY